MKILLGGSPCTYWSIAQKNNRETEPSGLGWELFKNYLIAKEKFKPDIFLYENNKSAAQAIKDEIKKQFGVWDGTMFMEDTGVRYIEINSALVSAQNRQRFYVHNCGNVQQPEDRGILLKDILESGIVEKEKGYCLKHQAGNARDYFKKHHTNIAFQPINITKDGKSHTIKAQYFKNGIANFITNGKHIASAVAVPIRIPEYSSDKARPLSASYKNKGCGEGTLASDCFPNNPNKQVFDYVAEPIRVGDMGSKAQGMCIYSVDGKSVCLNANGGGLGAKTGLYAEPVKYLKDKNMQHLMRPFGAKGKIVSEDTEKSPTLLAAAGAGGGNAVYYAECATFSPPHGYNKGLIQYDKFPTLTTGSQSRQQNVLIEKCQPDLQIETPLSFINKVYEVRNGYITIKDKQYPIKLKDGFYIIRKLTVTECCRLQTMPDDYCRAVSNSQAYKGLGNGWTAEVIIHILSNALKDVPRDTPIQVLSMYDGIGTGRYVLDKMGFTNVEYHAYEIDKYAMQIAMSNYPDIIQHGDAFQVRENDWGIE